MTKKIFVGMSAMAMLFATSCQDDMNLPGNVGETTTVAFNVSTPEIGTRAYSDGQTATVLQYAVYEGNVELDKLTKSVAKRNAETINTSKEVQLQLTTGNEYTVIFWAAAPNAPYTVNFADKTMTVDYTDAVSNDENRDAFYAAHTFTVSGAQTENVQLKRPFAQLNIGTEDYEEAKNAGYEPTKSMVTVKSLGNTLNLWDGTVSGTPQDVTFDYNAIPGKVDNVVAETFPVTGYEYLAMNYLLVPADQEVVDIEFGYTETDATAAKTRTVGSVPVQRNYRTNIYGKLLTSTVDVNVEIEPDFDEPAHGLAALQNAALNGGEVTLTENITLTTPLEVYGKMTINLNGKTISNPNGYAIENYSKLTISGEGNMSGLGGIRSHGGEIVINGGTFTGSSDWNNGTYQHILKAVNTEVTINGGEFDATIGGMTNAMINVSENSVVTINAGTFKNVNGMIPQFAPYMFTYEKNGKLIINGGDFYGGWRFNGETATTDIYGGNFTVSYDGQSFHSASTHVLTIYGGTFSLENGGKLNPANHLATGYKVLETTVDGVKYYSVVKEGAVIENPIVSASQLYALGGTKVSGTYNLLADIDMAGYDMKPIQLTSGNDYSLVFNGNGHTIKNLNLVQDYQNGMYVSGLFNILHSGKEITVNDLKLVNATSNSGKYSAVVLAYNSTTAVINLNNVDVDGATISAETVSPLVGYTTGSINLKDCDVANISMTGEKPEKIGAYVGTANQHTCNVIVSNCTNNTEYKEAGRVINGATMAIDGKQYVADSDGLKNALNAGVTNIVLAKGEFEMPTSFNANNVTISGIDKENSILKLSSQLRADNKSLTLKDLTTNVPTGLNYAEHSFAWIHYLKNFSMINCNSDGRIRLNSHSATIEDCRFDVTTSSGFDGYAIFYYGPTASNVKVSNSVFNTVGKAIVLYNEGKPVLNLDVTNCQFKSSASTDKAAIQMHTEYGISGTVDIVNSTATGFANINGGLWNEVNNNTKVSTDNFEITVDGVKVH